MELIFLNERADEQPSFRISITYSGEGVKKVNFEFFVKYP